MGHKLEREPRTLRQLLSDPMSLFEGDAPTTMETLPKAAGLVATFSDLRRLSKHILQDVQAVQHNIPSGEAKLPWLPISATYHGCRLPDTVPEKIRISACDLALPVILLLSKRIRRASTNSY